MTGWDEYDHAVTAANVPSTKVVHAKNDVTGEMEDVTCSLTGITQTGTKTVTNTMSLTFSDYDASYYEWNGHLIPRNDSTPALSGYENELLSSVGAASGSSDHLDQLGWKSLYRSQWGCVSGCNSKRRTADTGVPGKLFGSDHNPGRKRSDLYSNLLSSGSGWIC